MAEINDEWEITSVNSIPLSTASDWEVLSDDRAFSDDDVDLLSLASSPQLRRQRSSSADDAIAVAAEAAEAAAAAATDSDAKQPDAAATADDSAARLAAEAEVARLRRQLQQSQASLQRAQAELEATHVEVADAVASNTELQAQLDAQREASQRRIAALEVDTAQQQERLNNLNRQLVVSSLNFAPRRRGHTNTAALRRMQKKSSKHPAAITSTPVRSRPAKKWFQSHHHRAAYAQGRAPRGQKQAKRRGNDRY